MAFVVWLTGLPGSGKSTIANELLKLLSEKGIVAAHLRLDEFRKSIVPDPKFSYEERELVYSELTRMAASLFDAGKNVIVDAAAHRRTWRDLARQRIKGLVEVYVKCDLETCIDRESGRSDEGLVTADLYKKALERRRTGKKFKGLGEVVGVDVDYEPGDAELTIESDKLSAAESAEKIFEELKKEGLIK